MQDPTQDGFVRMGKRLSLLERAQAAQVLHAIKQMLH
jgi:hypothetical protein